VANEVEQVLGETESVARDRVLDRLRAYVEVETPSRHEEGIRKLAGMIARDLQEAGATVALTEAPGYGAHVVASFDGEQDGAHVVILSHMDTVHPIGTIATQPFVIKGERAEGPGIYDMKAGIAIAVEALHMLRRSGAKPKRPLRFVITCDEEIGSHSALPIITEQTRGAAAVLVTEPCIAGGFAKTARKGVLTYRMDVTGRAAHAGTSPTTGVSAIAELAGQIARVYGFARHDVGTTVNVGVIGGGTASNVVAAAAFADIDVRVVEMKEGERIHADLAAVQPIDPGASVSVRKTEKRPPLERSPAVVALYQEVRAIAAALGHDMGEGASGGGSDGSLTAAMGIPTLDGLGPDGGGAHAVDEHILTADIPYRLALFTSILRSYPQP
jgi:glutamate carboxypeptidase